MKVPTALAACATLLVSCGDDPMSNTRTKESSQPVIAAVNYPLAYFAERLAGDFATILFEAPADEDPAFWVPSDDQVSAIQKADVILLNGASYAKWTSTHTLPFAPTVVTSSAFEDKLIKIEGVLNHIHKEGEEDHSHSGTSFTTWMDFKQAGAQASEVALAISEAYPDHKETVMAKLQALLNDLKDLDNAMAAATTKLHDAPVIASHPVYHYWERAYGLKVPSLLREPEMTLDDEALADLKKVQDANPGAVFFVWEGEPSPENLAKIKAAGLTSLVVSPCGNRPENGDFLTVMRANIAAILSAAN